MSFLLLLTLSVIIRTTHAADTTTSLLMVGNSFIDANNMEYMVEQMLRQSPRPQEVYAMRFDQGSSRFAEHVQEPLLHEMIRERAWNWVLLQEQSEIPAFPGTYYEPTFDVSVQSLETLNGWIQEGQLYSETVLMMTWARVGADPYYPELFPNFEQMQQKVKEGYIRMQQTITTPERPVPIVPAGLAFQYIREHCCAEGQDPSSNGTEFVALYDEDTIHPSVWGSYLAACTIYATLTPVGYPAVTQIQYGPPGLNAVMKRRLQEAAQAAVLQFNNENPINRHYVEMKRAEQQNKRPYKPVSPADHDDSSSPASSPTSSRTTFDFTMSVLFPTALALVLVGNVCLWIQQKRQMASYSGRHTVPSSQDDEDDLQLRDALELPEIR